MLHVACHMSNASVDPWDKLKFFCFHVSGQMLLFMGENDNAFLDARMEARSCRPYTHLTQSHIRKKCAC